MSSSSHWHRDDVHGLYSNINKPIGESPPRMSDREMATINYSQVRIPTPEFQTKPYWSYAFIRLRPSATHFFYDLHTFALPSPVMVTGPSPSDSTPRRIDTLNKMVAIYYPHPKLPDDAPTCGILRQKIDIDPKVYDITRVFIYQNYEAVGRSRLLGVAILKKDPKNKMYTKHLHPRFKGEMFYEGKFREEFAWPVSCFAREVGELKQEILENKKLPRLGHPARRTAKARTRPEEKVPREKKSSGFWSRKKKDTEAERDREIARARKGKMKEKIDNEGSDIHPNRGTESIDKTSSAIGSESNRKSVKITDPKELPSNENTKKVVARPNRWNIFRKRASGSSEGTEEKTEK